MAITKDMAGKLTSKEKDYLNLAENAIDRILHEEYQEGKTLVINFVRFGPLGVSINSRVRREIIELYKKVGWEVEYHFSQTDGEWFEFS